MFSLSSLTADSFINAEDISMLYVCFWGMLIGVWHPDIDSKLKKENNNLEESNENLMPMTVHITVFILIHIVF